MIENRRDFIKKTALGTAGLGLSTISAKSYSNILGANDRLNYGIVGIHSRGKANMKAALAVPNTSIAAICDVDSRVLVDVQGRLKEMGKKKAKEYVDYREMLENKDIDVITIATPEHWHAPMAIMGAQAGKHVYVEKPCSHNPWETVALMEVEKKTGKKIQMGNQQRSAPTSIKAIKEIREGIIGDVYFGKAWYSNKRGPIGYGKRVPVPEWLNWDLWQGPAPRRDYQDIWVHYNWHWFWDYGTGEVHNNGTHEIDICRWALGVDYPERVSSEGGRFHYDDDWEFYDTQLVNYRFPENKMITWEGKSCNPFPHHGWGRGSSLHGTKGTILLDRNNYIVYDMDGNVVKHEKEEEESATTNTVGAGALDTYHMNNLANAIRNGEKQHSPISDAGISTQLCHYGNIAQATGDTLHIDTESGKIVGNGKAMQYWKRVYEPGWEPIV